jgi:Protein of unknown function (DUF3570)
VRLQLIAAVGVLSLTTDMPSRAEDNLVRIDTRNGVYQDDNATRIVTSTTAANADVGGGIQVGARYLIDVISSASVDVTSAATPRFEENRHEAATGVSWQGNGGKNVSLGYIYSTENDWWSHTVNLNGTLPLLSQNLSLSGGAGVVKNQVGRRDDPHFSEALDVYSATLGATYNLNPRTLVQLTTFGAFGSGFQSSPYRFARLASRTAVLERVPDQRRRVAITARLNRHFFSDSVLQLHARGYADDWGIRSVTSGAEWLTGFNHWTMGLRVRGYSQTQAWFFQDVYDAPMRYMSADKESSRFHDVFAGARLLWERPNVGFFSLLRAEFKVDVFRFWLPDFHRLPGRDGIMGEFALGATF